MLGDDLLAAELPMAANEEDGYADVHEEIVTNDDKSSNGSYGHEAAHSAEENVRQKPRHHKPGDSSIDRFIQVRAKMANFSQLVAKDYLRRSFEKPNSINKKTDTKNKQGESSRGSSKRREQF